MTQSLVHYGLHFILPLIIALLFFKKNWKKAYLIFLLTMLVDLDHLFSNPIFDSNRCSINFHPLHSFYAFAAYIILALSKKPFNIIGIGLVMHIMTYLIDCLFMRVKCTSCLIDSSVQNILDLILNLLKI